MTKAPDKDEISRLMASIMEDTNPSVRSEGIMGISGKRVPSVAQATDDGASYISRVNRLTFLEQGGSESGGATGTSNQHRAVDSLFVDLTASGMESTTDGGLPMMSARSTGNTTIDTATDGDLTMFEVYQFPTSLQELDKICRMRQSEGITACTRANCKLNHRGPRVDFPPGVVVVARSALSVFIDPKTESNNVSMGLLANWRATPRTLEDWNERFQLVNSREVGEPPFTVETLNQRSKFVDYAKEWTSPTSKTGLVGSIIGEKSTDFMTLVEEETITMTKDYLVETVFEDEDEDTIERGSPTAAVVLKRLEAKVDINGYVVVKLSERLDERADLVNEELKVLLTRLQRTENVIGPKVTPRNSKFDTPSVWASISTLAGAFDELRSDLLAMKAELITETVVLEKRVYETVEDQINDVMTNAAEMFSEQIDSIKETVEVNGSGIATTSETMLLLARGASKLKDEIAELRTIVNDLKATSGRNTPVTEDSSVLSDISSLKVMLKGIVQRVDNVVEGRESKAVKFFGLLFRGHSDAESWVVEHLDSDSYGLIVDAHLVFEHVYHSAFSEDGSLKDLNGLYKIKIDNLTQGLAVTSFDFAIPKFFSVTTTTANKKPKIKKPDSSHFDNIDTYEDWDLPLMGFRAKLKEHLEEFEETHVRMIGEALNPEDPAYRVATMSVQFSVGWIQNFIAYLDETYLDTVRLSSFTSARSWQLVTQIGRRILNEVSIPRKGVSKLFRVGDNAKIAQSMFWPMVQCHETMARYKKANFKDDPSVSNEFMKFMATNAGSTDGLSTVVAKLAKLEAEMKDALKSGKGADCSATNSANKADAVNKLVTSLIQRVTILEQENKGKK